MNILTKKSSKYHGCTFLGCIYEKAYTRTIPCPFIQKRNYLKSRYLESPADSQRNEVRLLCAFINLSTYITCESPSRNQQSTRMQSSQAVPYNNATFAPFFSGIDLGNHQSISRSLSGELLSRDVTCDTTDGKKVFLLFSTSALKANPYIEVCGDGCCGFLHSCVSHAFTETN